MRIQILDPLIANQIAAGEVIERPASVVKELMENSLDAGATELTLVIEKGGSGLIEVRDNGCGIEKEDLPLAVLRHGTSKIHQLTDLSTIATLGFRGEALASVSAVAKLEIRSAVAGQRHAWQLSAEGTDSQLQEKPVAHPVGTTVAVRDLFFNTPARRKFLRSVKTEFFHIEELVKRITLGDFKLKITLSHDDRKILQLNPASTEIQQEQRISQLCGKDFIDNAIKIDVEATGLRIWGWVGLPHYSRAQGDRQYMYINGRMVRDKLINHAIRQAYHQHLEIKRFPAYVLYLTCPANAVDVNVHPTKHEVRFREGRLIHDFVLSALKKVLLPSSSFDWHPKDNINYRDYAKDENRNNHSQAVSSYKTLYQSSSDSKDETCVLKDNPSVAVITNPSASSFADVPSWAKPIACLQARFIVAETSEGLCVVNIARARQEILKHKFTRALKGKSITSQPLLFPLTFKVSKQVFRNLLALQSSLSTLGFDTASLGEQQLVCRSAPQPLQQLNFSEFLVALGNRCDAKTTVADLIDAIAKLAPLSMAAPQTTPSMTLLLTELTKLKDNLKPPLPYKIFSFKELERAF